MPLPSERRRRRVLARALEASRKAESRYVQELRALARGIHEDTMRFLGPHLPSVARADSDKAFSGSFDLFNVRVVAAIPSRVGPAFDRMSREVRTSNARAMQVVGIRPSDLRVGAELSKRREENIRLVENAQRVYSQQVRDVFSDPNAHTLRVEELSAKLQERGDVSDSRAELIARDQVLKTNGAITRIRQTNAGVEEYTWSTSNDERVREEHVVLDGQRFSWATGAPNEGHPGEPIQCRCVAIPVIPELEDLDAPEVTPEPEPEPEPEETRAAIEPEEPEEPEQAADVRTMTRDDVIALGARSLGDIEEVSNHVFEGRAPTVEQWQKMWDPGPGYSIQFTDFYAGDDRELAISAHILANGQKIGNIDRTFMRDALGNLVVYHDFVRIEEEHQKEGVGRTLTRNTLRNYLNMGVTRVDLMAADIGRYAWAKFGFSWPKEDAEKWRRRLETFLAAELSDKDKAAILARVASQGAHEVARLKVDGREIGKEFLLQVPFWSGHLRLKDGDPGFERAKEYLGL